VRLAGGSTRVGVMSVSHKGEEGPWLKLDKSSSPSDREIAMELVKAVETQIEKELLEG
jgi:hypothetical protein